MPYEYHVLQLCLPWFSRLFNVELSFGQAGSRSLRHLTAIFGGKNIEPQIYEKNEIPIPNIPTTILPDIKVRLLTG